MRTVSLDKTHEALREHHDYQHEPDPTTRPFNRVVDTEEEPQHVSDHSTEQNHNP